MKKTLAIVLALAMVLCMMPATFAATTSSITDKSYTIKAESFGDMETGYTASKAEATKANSLTFNYKYEGEKTDVTGKFTEDKKMALVWVVGFDADLLNAADMEITIDGKKLDVNENAAYKNQVGFDNVNGAVCFPVELTKAGYSDTYLVTVKGKNTAKDVVITETAKVSLKMVNGSEYKDAKTATISAISGSKVDAYIVGDKIYLDFASTKTANTATVDVTFKDENGSLFSVVTWASNPSAKKGAPALYLPSEKKLDKSKMTYTFDAGATGDQLKEVSFKLETASGLYATKKYDVVVRENIVETDPKGIYFAESVKTIKVGETYTPVVMGVATNKKVNADIMPGANTSRDVIDITDKTVVGTKEGVAYITAKYESNSNPGNPYTASSMKIVVTAGDVVLDSTTYVVTCRTLNVRKGAGTSYAKAGKLSRGTKVQVVSIDNGWAKLADGNFVAAKYISK